MARLRQPSAAFQAGPSQSQAESSEDEGSSRNHGSAHQQNDGNDDDLDDDLDNDGINDEGLDNATDFNTVVDMDQPLEERRRIQRELRQLIKRTDEDQNAFFDVKAKVLHTVLSRTNKLMAQTRQTAEATVDASLMVRVSELAYKRTNHFLADRTGDTGVSLDDFVLRCQEYMMLGRGIADDQSAELSRSQRRQRAARRRGAGAEGGSESRGPVNDADDDADDGDDDDDDDDDGGNNAANSHTPDWTHFGQYACLPRVRRPALARFLPRMTRLATADKTKAMRKRTAALRLNDLPEVRPEVLRADELAVSQANDLTALAKNILQQLRVVFERSQAEVQEEYEAEAADGDDARLMRLMDRHGLRSDGGVDLVRFAVNPHSFSQTIENLFYISFLVRDGRVGLAYDDNGLPSIFPVSEEDIESAKANSAREEDTSKHQLILAMDMATWRDLIRTFHIQEPLIAHREAPAQAHPGGRTWFA